MIINILSITLLHKGRGERGEGRGERGEGRGERGEGRGERGEGGRRKMREAKERTGYWRGDKEGEEMRKEEKNER